MRTVLSLFMLFSLVACNSIDDSHLDGKPAHHTVNGFKNLYVEDPQKNLFSFLKV
ncbi:MAG: hypothetical protein HWE30_12565 [Methylocystaceae bacterium]|nr:hypothetical protein [Methylocystaceae bacterium]